MASPSLLGMVSLVVVLLSMHHYITLIEIEVLGRLEKVWDPSPSISTESEGLNMLRKVWEPFPSISVGSDRLGKLERAKTHSL